MEKNFQSCNLAADYFLLQIDPNAGDSISNLKMQKLCYYAQAWSLALRDAPIFNDKIIAWAHGPAIPSLYNRFRQFQWGAIDPFKLVTEPLKILSSRERDVLDSVWLRYGGLSGKQLEELTHSESPWRDAYGDRPCGEKCHTVILHDSMRDYYREMSNLPDDANPGATVTAT